MIFRKINKLYANLFGYFWLPCPSCDKMFGGHEGKAVGGKTVLRDGRTYCVCPDCERNPEIKDERFARGALK